MFQSCAEDETISTITNEAQASFEMRATTTTPANAGGRLANTGYTFTEVYAGVTEIELETLEENQQEDALGEDENEEVEFEGNFVINLLTGTSDPDFGISTIQPGVYEEVELEFENILEGNKTLIVNFNYTPAGATEPTFVEFSTAEEFELELENEAGFVLDAGMVNPILVTLNLTELFAAVDLSTLMADEDGVIRINETSNSSAMDSIVEKLEVALEAEEDDDEDDDDDKDED